MRVRFLDKIAGIPEGTVKNLPTNTANAMIDKGYAVSEEEKPEVKQPKKKTK